MSVSPPSFTLLLGNLPTSVRTALTRLLSVTSGLEVVGTAMSTTELSVLARRLRPGVALVTEDELSGLEQLQRQFQVPVLLYCAGVPLLGMLREATRLGVYDYITAVPTTGPELAEWNSQLRRKLLAARPRAVAALPAAISRPRTVPLPPQGIVVIGGSTGGAPAVETVLQAIPVSFPWAIVVAVHLPAHFTDTLVERLRRITHLPVEAAGSGSRLVAGRVLVAPGGYNITVQPVSGSPWLGWQTDFVSEASLDVPSIDILMQSAARLAGRNVLGVVLTGLGQDGTAGARAIRQAGGTVIVQDEASSAVFGMPKSVIQAGLATEVHPLSGIAGALISHVPTRPVSLSTGTAGISRLQPVAVQ
ncbi:chemotaxis protein CheB [Hymenobacter rigui]|uniref:protein-glutamate methylesterase n=1 Tax=Hymenobacter rigui TaxID=334424 RepID=A0A428KV14_9BACT|nr:chemotaxis protein CheB [Hymenobacter rigui]RSK50343.1 chemotaxis protein CheB [Hymenobacter rigui]